MFVPRWRGVQATLLIFATATMANAEPLVEPCKVLTRPNWNAQETWVWRRICAGMPADFNVAPGGGGSIDPASPEWPATRKLTGTFLRALLLQPPYREAVPSEGIRITGAWFPGEVDLTDGIFARPLTVEASRFDADVKLQRIKTDRYVSFQRSVVAKTLDLSFSTFEQVALGEGRFGAITMAAATVNNQLVLTRAHVHGTLNLFATRVAQSVFLNEAVLECSLRADRMIVNGNVNLLGTTLRSASLSGARIDGPLLVGPNQRRSGTSVNTKWTGDNASLVLRDAQIGSLNTTTDSTIWPPHVDLTGLKYGRFSRIPPAGASLGGIDFLDGDVDWFLRWLEKSPFSAQPYRHLADVFSANGYPEKAQRVLYEEKNGERRRAHCNDVFSMAGISKCVDKAFLILTWLFIGYGYRLYYIISWITAFVLLGALIFSRSFEARVARMPYGFAYSFDALVPLVTLRSRHKDIDLHGWQRYYFYVHRLMGYVFATFVAAGLSGLTK